MLSASRDHRPFIAEACVVCGSEELARSPAVLMPFVADRVFGWRPVEITPEWGLQTVRPGMAYSLCTSLQCKACAHLFLDIRFTPDQLQRLYRNYQDDTYASHRARYEPGYIGRNARLKQTIAYLPAVEDLIRPHVPERPRILDWGGSRGDNTPFRGTRAAHDIFDISGEPPVEGARFVPLETAVSGDYDLIVCSNVLEHVPYPLDTLHLVASAMRPGTALYLEIPLEDIMRRSVDSPEAHLSKRHWHEHINFYSRQSLEHLVLSCGLDIVDISFLDVGDTPGSSSNYALICRRSCFGKS